MNQHITLILQIIVTIVATILAAWSYRFGGSSNGIRWVREIGVAVAEVIVFSIWFGFNWGSVLIFGTAWGMSTYFKKKGTDAKWWNWLLVGVVLALIPLPQVFDLYIHHIDIWKGFFIRAAFIIPFTTIFCTFFGGNVQWSEGVRGGIQIVSLPMMKFFK